MSFILEALRKAEHEQRQTDTAPQPPGLSPAPPAVRRRGLIVALLVLNLTLLAWLGWHSLRDPAADPVTLTGSVEIAAEPLAAEPPPLLTPSHPDPALARLQLDIHVYGDRPERRFVLIDGRRYRQGDSLEPGLLLETITPDGAIFNHRGRRLTLKVSD